ncbi:MAG: hypothetical protein PHP62_00615 [Candidatus Moranbacteria bacterium]|nr:hypothetical protein [Candidatus Moranbacteria bacterium]
MQNNDNNGHGGHDSKMMWLMMLPCLLLPIIFVVISGRGLSAIFGNWQWITSIAFMIGIHVVMMKFMHGHKEESSVNDKK